MVLMDLIKGAEQMRPRTDLYVYSKQSGVLGERCKTYSHTFNQLWNTTAILFIFSSHATQPVEQQNHSQKISLIMERCSWFQSSQHSRWKWSSKRQTATGVQHMTSPMQAKQMNEVFNSSFHSPSPVLGDAEQKYFWTTSNFFLVNNCKLFGEIHRKKKWKSSYPEFSSLSIQYSQPQGNCYSIMMWVGWKEKQHTENCLHKSSWRDQNIFRVTYTYSCKMHSDNIIMSWQ